MHVRRLLPALLLLTTAAHADDTPALGNVTLRGERFAVEVVADDASRARGLMFRESMAADRGMLFVFEFEQPLAFWMRNTKIPLDILYFDRDRKLVGMHVDVPPCRTVQCPTYPSDRPAQWTVELNAGTAKRLGVQLGDVVEIEMPTP